MVFRYKLKWQHIKHNSSSLYIILICEFMHDSNLLRYATFNKSLKDWICDFRRMLPWGWFPWKQPCRQSCGAHLRPPHGTSNPSHTTFRPSVSRIWVFCTEPNEADPLDWNHTKLIAYKLLNLMGMIKELGLSDGLGVLHGSFNPTSPWFRWAPQSCLGLMVHVNHPHESTAAL